MLGIARWLVAKIATYWDVISSVLAWVVPIAGGAMTGWAAWAANLLPIYAPFSWVFCGILGGVLLAGGYWLLARGNYWMAHANWARTWTKPSDDINPLDDNFVRRRIKLNDFVSPAHQIIESKVFDRCEIIGPALIVMKDSNLHSPAFFDTNFICAKDNTPVNNAIQIVNCNFLNCKFYKLTLLVAETGVVNIPNVPWLSRTPDEFSLPVPWDTAKANQK